MTYAEVMILVDAGRFVSHELDWKDWGHGFAWAPWVRRQRSWTKGDKARVEVRSSKGDWGRPSIEPTGPYYRAWNTLCESVSFTGDSVPLWEREATDWVDVTDRFVEGTPRGYFKYMYPTDPGVS